MHWSGGGSSLFLPLPRVRLQRDGQLLWFRLSDVSSAQEKDLSWLLLLLGTDLLPSREREREDFSCSRRVSGRRPFSFFSPGPVCRSELRHRLACSRGKESSLGGGGGSKQSGGVDQNVGIVRIIPIAGLKSVQLMSSLGDPPPFGGLCTTYLYIQLQNLGALKDKRGNRSECSSDPSTFGPEAALRH